MFKSLRHLDETLTTANCNEDTYFVKVVESMTSDKSRIWNASGSSGTVSLPWWEKLSNELEPNLRAHENENIEPAHTRNAHFSNIFINV